MLQLLSNQTLKKNTTIQLSLINQVISLKDFIKSLIRTDGKPENVLKLYLEV